MNNQVSNDGMSNQNTPNGAKPSHQPNEDEDEDDLMTDGSELANPHDLIDEDADSEVEDESIGNAHLESMTPAGSPPSTTTPRGSPPEGLLDSILDGTYITPLATEPKSKLTSRSTTKAKTPKISLTTISDSQTPWEAASTPADSATLKPLNLEDDYLSEEDLPGPWANDAYQEPLDDCEDLADYLLQRRFEAMSDVNRIIAAFNKFPAAQRSTENLYALAENAQYILRYWQDEYLELDARVSSTTLLEA